MRHLSKQEARDIQMGASIMSTGGGGDLSLGYEAIDICEHKGHSLRLLSMDQVKENDWYVSVGMIGSISEESFMPTEKIITLMKPV